MLKEVPTPIVSLESKLLDKFGVAIKVKRDDLNHEYVSGNKFWKLKHNLQQAVYENKQTLLTFGGAYSNHIYATAAAARECGLRSIGIIRGEEPKQFGYTLRFARQAGMTLKFVTRDSYKFKNDPEFITSQVEALEDCYIIPEGGTNEAALKGVMEMGKELFKESFDYIFVPVGTGGTLSGLVGASEGRRNIIGFSSLKGEGNLSTEINDLISKTSSRQFNNWSLITNYHQGGYAKITPELISFLKDFEAAYGFKWDPIYNGKMAFAVFDLITKGYFPPGSTILLIHTGGLQGWEGIKERFNIF